MNIWKYNLAARDMSGGAIEMPRGARILDVQMQAGYMHAWAMVDRQAPIVHRRFGVYGTGHDIPDSPGDYIATVQDGSFVWHVFDLGEEEL